MEGRKGSGGGRGGGGVNMNELINGQNRTHQNLSKRPLNLTILYMQELTSRLRRRCIFGWVYVPSFPPPKHSWGS